VCNLSLDGTILRAVSYAVVYSSTQVAVPVSSHCRNRNVKSVPSFSRYLARSIPMSKGRPLHSRPARPRQSGTLTVSYRTNPPSAAIELTVRTSVGVRRPLVTKVCGCAAMVIERACPFDARARSVSDKSRLSVTFEVHYTTGLRRFQK